MTLRSIGIIAITATIGTDIIGAGQSTAPNTQSQTASPTTPAPVRSGGVLVPTITLGAGLTPVPDYNQVTPPEPPPQIPDGFVPLFNGKDLSG